jgi:uncharacterized YccA/Bax inhibitor family protein
MRSGNPVLRDSVFQDAQSTGKVMTLNGVVNKTGILLLLCMAGFAVAWYQPTPAPALLIAGALGGLVLALVTSFVPKVAPFTSPVYAILEGLFLGAISAIFENSYKGIASQAAMLTFGTLAVMLTLYKTRIIRVTDTLRSVVIGATCAVALLYVVGLVLSMFGSGIPFIHSSGTFGIIFSLAVVGLAAFNLLLDFDFIEQGVYAGAPKYLEWYAGFSMLVTLVWLYLEILRLLAKLRGRD